MDIGLHHLFNQQGQGHDSPKVRAMLYKHELQEMNHKLKDLFGDIWCGSTKKCDHVTYSLLIDYEPRAALAADNQMCPNRVLRNHEEACCNLVPAMQEWWRLTLGLNKRKLRDI